MQQIAVKGSTESIIPRAIVEARLSVTPNQMDVLAIILAEIGKDTDIDSNLEYTLSVTDYANLKGYEHINDAYKVLKDKVCGCSEKSKTSPGMRHIGFDMCTEDNHFKQYNWFSSIDYYSGVATFNLTPEIKAALVDFKKNDEYKVFAKLRYILPMKSQYSKRIYLMCREFISSGERYCDKDWKLFLEKLGVPKSYRYAQVKKLVLEKAKEEIEQYSDILIDYEITEKSCTGGKQPISIKFKIKKQTDIKTIEDWS